MHAAGVKCTSLAVAHQLAQVRSWGYSAPEKATEMLLAAFEASAASSTRAVLDAGSTEPSLEEIVLCCCPDSYVGSSRI
eukprot:35177-Amphidinium_carterae.2